MARDCVALMRALGHERFAVAGHDRGAYVASRTAFDHPERGAGARGDGRRPDRRGARPLRRDVRPRVVALVLPRPDGEARRARDLRRPGGVVPPEPGADGRGEPRRLPRAPSTTRPPCTPCARTTAPGSGSTGSTTRTTARAGRRVACPMLLLWSIHDDMEQLYGDPVAVWRPWADDLRGGRIDSGHHMAEEAPEQLAEALRGLPRRRGLRATLGGRCDPSARTPWCRRAAAGRRGCARGGRGGGRASGSAAGVRRGARRGAGGGPRLPRRDPRGRGAGRRRARRGAARRRRHRARRAARRPRLRPRRRAGDGRGGVRDRRVGARGGPGAARATARGSAPTPPRSAAPTSAPGAVLGSYAVVDGPVAARAVVGNAAAP